jgi:cold shock CspA family protein
MEVEEQEKDVLVHITELFRAGMEYFARVRSVLFRISNL